MSLIDLLPNGADSSNYQANGLGNNFMVNGVLMAGKEQKIDYVIAAMQENNCFHYVSDGSWCTHDFLIKAMALFAQPVEVYITTYSMTEFSARVLAGFVHDKRISNLQILMDTKSFTRYPAVHQLINNISRLKLTPLHAKVLVMMNNEKAITLMSSSNWTKNPKIEVGEVSQSRALAEFHVDWITNKMNSIK